MTHDEAVELLPWLANGSLGEVERATLLAHLASCEACRRELDETLVAGRLLAAAHPPTPALVAHVWGEGDPAARAAIERHVALCADCRTEIDLALASRALATPAPSPLVFPRSRDRAAVAWRPWLRVAALVALTLGTLIAALAWGRGETERRRLAARTVLLEQELSRLKEVAVGAEQATARRSEELARQLAALVAPQAGVPLLELVPLGLARGAPDLPTPRLAAAESTFATLLLPLERPRPGATYGLRLLAPDGSELFARAGLAADARGALTLQLATETLPEGVLVVEVRPESGPTREPARYRFEVVR